MKNSLKNLKIYNRPDGMEVGQKVSKKYRNKKTY